MFARISGNRYMTCLRQNELLIRKYKRFVLYLPDESEHPKILIKYFKKFAKDHHTGFRRSEIDYQMTELKKDTAYLIIQQKDLVSLVKRCRTEKLHYW